MLTAADQTAIIAAMPGTTTAIISDVVTGITGTGLTDAGVITVDYRVDSEPIMLGDGSVEAGKPYCIAAAADVDAYVIDHGTALTIADLVYYVIGKNRRQDGMYRLILSKTYE